MLEEGQIPDNFAREVRVLITVAEPLGPEVHVQTDYGDEMSGLTPWDLFDEEDASEALKVAQGLLQKVEELIWKVTGEGDH